jgi:hypothetical protein
MMYEKSVRSIWVDIIVVTFHAVALQKKAAQLLMVVLMLFAMPSDQPYSV